MRGAVQLWFVTTSFAVLLVMGSFDAHAGERGATVCRIQADKQAALQCAQWSIECGKRFVRESGTGRYEADVNRCIDINTGYGSDYYHKSPPVAAPYGKSICATLHQQYPGMPLRNCN